MHLIFERVNLKNGLFFKGWVVMLTGGIYGSSTPYVELYSPNGMCNYALANLPTDLYAHTLGVYNGKVLVCVGYSQTYGHLRDCYRYNNATNTA